MTLDLPALFDPHTTDEVKDGCFSTAGQDLFFSPVYKMRIWAMYRSKKVLFSMTLLVFLSLVAMGLLEGFGYSNVKGLKSHE
ncbi:hypothetical protein Clacol_007228 [Clathrus columnatus]|uniref:Uncharacterized protein n=1 Tax=Clathrus columnatus TaxID=1419009 RepID=A0AAV5AKK6_9AGAM|nr:hypothetical protein Clacol_007228 [Clathrus columnatus]